MKKAAAILALLAIGWFAGANSFLLGLRFRWPWGSVPESRATTLSPEKADFAFMGRGTTRACVWGDANKGPYGAYTKFEPGFTAPLHFHSSDMNFMVLKGAYIYQPESGEAKRIESGSYIFIPGGEPHECRSDAKDGVLFYDVSQGPFDVVIGRK